MPDIKRQTAYKCTIGQIVKNPYVQMQGWEPSYLEFGDHKVSRVNVLATVVNRDVNNMTVDDGTGSMQIMLFTDADKAVQFMLGDVLLIIGRPRQYNGRKYIAPEIMRKITDTKWIEYRKKELEMQGTAYEERTESPPVAVEQVEEISMRPEGNYASIILGLIKKLDGGDGADTDRVIKESNVTDAEKVIMNLLYEGEIFEIRAGKLKVLE